MYLNPVVSVDKDTTVAVEITETLEVMCPWHANPSRPLVVDVPNLRAVCGGCGRKAQIIEILRPLGDGHRRYALLKLVGQWHGSRNHIDAVQYPPGKPLG